METVSQSRLTFPKASAKHPVSYLRSSDYARIPRRWENTKTMMKVTYELAGQQFYKRKKTTTKLPHVNGLAANKTCSYSAHIVCATCSRLMNGGRPNTSLLIRRAAIICQAEKQIRGYQNNASSVPPCIPHCIMPGHVMEMTSLNHFGTPWWEKHKNKNEYVLMTF